MNVPAVARKTYLELRNQYEYSSVYKSTLTHLKKISDFLRRAKFIQLIVDEHKKEVLSHPLVPQLSPFKKGCSACRTNVVLAEASQCDTSKEVL